MTQTALATEFPWLHRDAADILGDSRPRTLRELRGKSRLWQDLYRDWLADYNSSYLDGWTYLSGSKAQATEAKARLRRGYPTFYKAAGDLKDAVRKRPANVAAQFPWAPSDPRALLGDARPKDLDELLATGGSAQWVSAYRGWLGKTSPDDQAWFDWVQADGATTQQWEQALDPTVEAFATDIGRLKDRLRETHGNKAERILRQVGEVVDDVVDGVSGAFTQQAEPGSVVGSPAGGGGAAGAGGWQGARPGGAGPGAQGAQPMKGTRAARAAQRGQAQPGGQGGPGPGQPGGRSGQQGQQRQRDPLEPSLRGQLDLAHNLWPEGPNYATKCRWVGKLMQQWGGVFAGDGALIMSYAESVQQYSDTLRGVQTRCWDAYRTPGANLNGAIIELRNAVYGLAWTIDLAFQSNFGDWPQRRVGYLIDHVEGCGNERVQSAARAPLRSLLYYIADMYPEGVQALDTALAVISDEPEGYRGGDMAEAWGTHEIVGAQAEAAAAMDRVCWAPPDGGYQEPDAEADQVAEGIFGLGLDMLTRLAGARDDY